MKDVMYDLFCMCIILVVHIFLRRGVCVSGVRVFCDKARLTLQHPSAVSRFQTLW